MTSFSGLLADTFDRNMCCAPQTLDRIRLDGLLARELTAERAIPLHRTHPHLFANEILFVSQAEHDAIASLIAAVERIRHSAPYLARLGSCRFARPETLGVFTSYDFHLTVDGPRLIEINTNAGGAYLAAAAGAAHDSCCTGASHALPDYDAFARRVIDMFAAEWRRAGRTGMPKTIAIVDDDPPSQFLFPEFLMAQTLLRRHGIAAIITDPAHLTHTSEGLFVDERRVDMVYNRHTDFALARPEMAALAAAIRADSAVVSPHPFHHAALASKANMVALSDPEFWADCGLPTNAHRFAGLVPHTTPVSGENADALWRHRKDYYFKPRDGHAGKGVYRGAKMTKSVWQSVIAGGYLAQQVAMPSARLVKTVDGDTALKADLRAYTYGPDIILLAGRLYQGQTTNMRTQGGGFAPVVIG